MASSLVVFPPWLLLPTSTPPPPIRYNNNNNDNTYGANMSLKFDTFHRIELVNGSRKNFCYLLFTVLCLLLLPLLA